MSSRSLQTSRYSPGNLAPAVLERLLVGRAELLDELVNKVSRSILTKDKQHMLLIGPRGTGKTHLMALLHQRLTTDPALAAERAKSVIVYLNEEEWGIASFLDFLLTILLSIDSGHGEIASQIALVGETFARDPARARDLAENALQDAIKGRTLVLLCENLHDLFEGLGAEGQARWRSLVQEQRSWCIVATAPSLFADVSRQTEPFYGFFTIRSLEQLSLDEAIELLRRKAELEGRRDLAEALDTPTGRARVRAIHHIVGGNHRAYIVLSQYLTKESLDDLVAPFMNMVDDLTPYFQERMRSLTSPLQRKLVSYLCKQRRPSAVRDIARLALVQPQSAAKQLGELAKSGLVQKTSRGRESYYELSDPLMRICIEVRDNRAGYVESFVELLRHWFSSRELESNHHPLYEEALASAEQGKLDVNAVAERLAALGAIAQSRSLRSLSGSTRQGVLDILGGLARENGDTDVQSLLEILDSSLWLEPQQRGPASFAAQVAALNDRLPRAARGAAISGSLSGVLRRLIRTRSAASGRAGWADALQKLSSQLPALGALLQLFSVGVRYAETRDASVLLELPLEQRRLLLDETGKTP